MDKALGRIPLYDDYYKILEIYVKYLLKFFIRDGLYILRYVAYNRVCFSSSCLAISKYSVVCATHELLNDFLHMINNIILILVSRQDITEFHHHSVSYSVNFYGISLWIGKIFTSTRLTKSSGDSSFRGGRILIAILTF